MPPIHDHVATHRGYEIYRRQPGFEYTPVLLGKIASFVVRGPAGSLTAAAFMYSLLPLFEGREIDEARLLDEALEALRAAIDRGAATDGCDLTFEYADGRWLEAPAARWWISVFR